MVDYCTVDDVKKEGKIEIDSMDDSIEYKITDVSEFIDLKKKDVSEEYYLKKVCIFGVLMWLERQKLIASTKNAQSMSEGDLSMSVGLSKKSSYENESYSDWYYYYLSMIMNPPEPGRVVGVSAEYYPGGE